MREREADSRKEIERLWRHDPHPEVTLGIQGQIDRALTRGAVAYATDRHARPVGRQVPTADRARADFELGLAQLWAARSPDEGSTWLPPVLAGTKPLPPDIVDPETGIPLPQVDAHGTVGVTWYDFFVRIGPG